MEPTITYLGCTSGLSPNYLEGCFRVALDMSLTPRMIAASIEHQYPDLGADTAQRMGAAAFEAIVNENLSTGASAEALDFAYFAIGRQQ